MMGWTGSTAMEYDRCIQNFSRKIRRKKPFGRPRLK